MQVEYEDDFGNRAIIFKRRMKPYNDATNFVTCYVVDLYGNDNFVYHRACYDNQTDAAASLKQYSGGTFKRI